MRLGWSTDLHLDRLSVEARDEYLKSSLGVDAWIMSGDISGGKRLVPDLESIADTLPLYFTLGNHEYYQSTFAARRRAVSNLGKDAHYLSTSEPIELTSKTCIVGDDGWYDARKIVPLTNWVFSIDWMMIKDFWLEDGNKERLALVQQLAWESTDRLVKKLRQINGHYEKIILATHFPPWRQRHRHTLLDRFWTPYNTNHFLGEALTAMFQNTSSKLLVLSGHTHIEQYMRISNNIKCLIGASRKQIIIEA